jgi:hypothetical protein
VASLTVENSKSYSDDASTASLTETFGVAKASPYSQTACMLIWTTTTRSISEKVHRLSVVRPSGRKGVCRYSDSRVVCLVVLGGFQYQDTGEIFLKVGSCGFGQATASAFIQR